jgi:hypothetical protein
MKTGYRVMDTRWFMPMYRCEAKAFAQLGVRQEVRGASVR